MQIQENEQSMFAFEVVSLSGQSTGALCSRERAVADAWIAAIAHNARALTHAYVRTLDIRFAFTSAPSLQWEFCSQIRRLNESLPKHLKVLVRITLYICVHCSSIHVYRCSVVVYTSIQFVHRLNM